MRRLFAAALLLAGLASPAFAQRQTPPAAAAPPAPVTSTDLPPLPDENSNTSTVAADLSGLYVRIEQDEVVITRLRDAELARENARLRAIKPALAFKGSDWFPLKY